MKPAQLSTTHNITYYPVIKGGGSPPLQLELFRVFSFLPMVPSQASAACLQEPEPLEHRAEAGTERIAAGTAQASLSCFP